MAKKDEKTAAELAAEPETLAAGAADAEDASSVPAVTDGDNNEEKGSPFGKFRTPEELLRAYGELEKRGLIMTIPKKGAFVRGESSDERYDEAVRQLSVLKGAGLSESDALRAVAEVYGSARGKEEI